MAAEKSGASPALCVLSGLEAGLVIRLPVGRSVIGRDPQSQITLDRANVSWHHAEIIVQPGWRVFISDLGSTNGTRINGASVRQRPVVLQEGDRVQVGDVLLKLAFHDVLEEQVQRALYHAAAKDALTGAHNRRYLGERLEQEFAYSERHSTPLAVILFDLDHFKRINDVHGHLAGDIVLREIARLVMTDVRREDVFARYGGEEFALVMRETRLEDALLVAERIRRRIEANEIDAGVATIRITISTGVAERTCGPYGSATDLMMRADELLYQAKGAGRNRVCYDRAA
jgi:diguanylate cyclase (GGDEF)-like protein